MKAIPIARDSFIKTGNRTSENGGENDNIGATRRLTSKVKIAWSKNLSIKVLVNVFVVLN
jgi:hypothetical protein